MRTLLKRLAGEAVEPENACIINVIIKSVLYRVRQFHVFSFPFFIARAQRTHSFFEFLLFSVLQTFHSQGFLSRLIDQRSIPDNAEIQKLIGGGREHRCRNVHVMQKPLCVLAKVMHVFLQT